MSPKFVQTHQMTSTTTTAFQGNHVHNVDFPFPFADLDDIVVVSRSNQEHYEHLQRVFEVIADYGFQVKVQKCTFLQGSVTYLGNIFNKYGLFTI